MSFYHADSLTEQALVRLMSQFNEIYPGRKAFCVHTLLVIPPCDHSVIKLFQLLAINIIHGNEQFPVGR